MDVNEIDEAYSEGRLTFEEAEELKYCARQTAELNKRHHEELGGDSFRVTYRP